MCILAFVMRIVLASFLLISGAHLLCGQGPLRGLVDAHVHYNGDKAFLEKMAARLDPFDGTAFILTQPKDIPDVTAAIKQHPKRFIGLARSASTIRWPFRSSTSSTRRAFAVWAN